MSPAISSLDPSERVAVEGIRWWASRCDMCDREMTEGLHITAADALPLLALCIWCTAVALTDATGYNLLEQLLSFYVVKHRPIPAEGT